MGIVSKSGLHMYRHSSLLVFYLTKYALDAKIYKVNICMNMNMNMNMQSYNYMITNMCTFYITVGRIQYLTI